ncbi:MAG: phosphoribosylformylglycinamidine synthase [Candidatus Cloacimonetes bacterium]|nr:phosphoribosylformylglycinamidine synthase [Candidatus Cloacimonadota bacterium]
MKDQVQLVLKDSIRDVRGEQVAARVKNYLGYDTGIIRTGKVYTIMYDLNKKDLKQFAQTGLADEILHDIYINAFYKDSFYRSYILISKLPGVTDDEGMSAQKTLSDMMGMEIDTATQNIFSHDVYYFGNKLDREELAEIAEKLLGNPLIHHFEYGKSLKKVEYIPLVRIKKPDKPDVINIFEDDEELLRLSRDMLLSLNLQEMRAIKSYFKQDQVMQSRIRRGMPANPTDCELEILAQTWSEHCKHKEFNAVIHYRNLETGEELEINSLFETYIKKATQIIMERLEKTGNNWLLKVFNDNAGVVRIDEDTVFVWKVETHNSPSAIDPYGGAITGILGNNRDPLGTGMGGAKLIFNTDVLCFGPLDYNKELLPGQLHPRTVFSGVRHGIEDGGNKSGIPTVNGAIIFDERYSGKPLVYCGTGGIMPSRVLESRTWEKRISAGDIIIMAGGRVGKDGIHGATFSSAEIDENSPQSAVQIGSPLTQKLLMDFMQEAVQLGLIRCSTDNGAGGLSSAVGELAKISGGALVNLEQVPLKYTNLKPWEIFISESQERMILVVTDDKKEILFKLAADREVELSDIGTFTDTGFLDVRYNNKRVALLDLEFLHEGVPQKMLEAEWIKPDLEEPQLPEITDYNKILLDLLASDNICSRESVIRQYDHEVQARTVIKPLMGPEGKAAQDAAVLRLTYDGFEGIAVANGIHPRYGDIDPYQMSAGAFDEAVRQIIAVGGCLPEVTEASNRFWSVNDNFCVPDSVYDPVTNTDGKLKLAKLVQMNQALYDMSTYFNIPMTSGKDSMKNDFRSGYAKISVPPTILYSMVAKIDDVRKSVTGEFKASEDLVYLLGRTHDELGGSEFYRLFGQLGANVPVVRKEKAKWLYKKIAKANELRLLESCHDISDGGMLTTLAECCIGSGLGADIWIDGFQDIPLNVIMFSETHSRFIVSVKQENRQTFENIFVHDGIFLGQITDSPILTVSYGKKIIIESSIEDMTKAWDKGLEK